LGLVHQGNPRRPLLRGLLGTQTSRAIQMDKSRFMGRAMEMNFDHIDVVKLVFSTVQIRNKLVDFLLQLI
jgi:hypothetical protein